MIFTRKFKLNTLTQSFVKSKPIPPPPPPLPKEPTDEEHHWLNPEGTPANQVMVLETDAWITAQAKSTFIGSRNSIHKLLQETIYNGVEAYRHHGTKNLAIAIKIDEHSTLDGTDFRIYYYYFSRHQILLLIDLTSLNIVNPTHPINKGEKLSEESLPADIDREDLIRSARRAYPLDVFLLEKEQYFQIQHQQEGNLALSPEESDVLAHVYCQSENRFPLFINGRAGSGKSTLLQYLLKDYLYLCFAHWDPESQYFPLYLTYSNNLLQTARQHIEMLLEANADILLKSDGTWVKTYAQNKNDVFDKTFKRFRDFLITLLPEHMTPDFDQPSRIGYAQFKRIWHEKAPWKQRKKYSVDLVWHIIRTYIKGMAKSEIEYLTPEDYRALPRKHKTVADTDYEVVFESVWKGWYGAHCKEVGAWDDQDLALRVLSSAIFPTCYPAIFCDEAQDFTALELKILYHLSLFSDRTVPNYAIGNIPFVFAGDPLQTLNSTGFRWEAVKASFHDFLLGPIESRSRTKSDLNYQELAANYRSSKPVVDFCNYIQLLSSTLLSDALS